jgi:hypothetical protein
LYGLAIASAIFAKYVTNVVICVGFCQEYTRTQYYIYKAIPVIAEEMIDKKLWLQSLEIDNTHHSLEANDNKSLIITCGTWKYP